MNKKFTKLKIRFFIFALIEVVLIGVFTIFYFLDIFSLQEICQPIYFIWGAIALIVINLLMFFFGTIQFSKYKDDYELSVSKTISKDLGEVYNFAKLGYIICDDKNNIVWTSDYFKNKNINVVNKDIFEVFPSLKDFHDKDIGSTQVIEYNNSHYNVKYLKNSNIYIFVDNSDFEDLSFYSKEHAQCLGMILIDNYNELVKNGDDNNDAINKAKSLLFDYAKDYGVLLRRIKNESYFAICTFSSLQKMREDGFTILDKVKEIPTETNIQITLSIGFAYGFPDVEKLNDMAGTALDMAMSRGGDQIVISKYGSDVEFIGGKNEAVESKNKVKIRVFADSLIQLITESSNVVVMGHYLADMDAIGACLGIIGICNSLNKKCQMVFDKSKIVEKKARIAVVNNFNKDELVKISVAPKDISSCMNASTLLIVVDISKPELTICPQALDLTEKVVVIDHHRRAESFIDYNVLNYIDTSASSTCEIITEMVRFSTKSSNIKINPNIASFMLAGIFLDTQYFKNSSVGIRAFEASMILKEWGADNNKADDMLKDDFEEYSYISNAVNHLETPFYGVALCVVDDVVDQETLAKIANQCMQLKGNNAAFAIGKINDNDVKISARSDGTINVQLICEKFPGANGGGHLTMAALNIKNTTVENAKSILEDVLKDYIAIAKKDLKGD